jgi:hypothetical protein
MEFSKVEMRFTSTNRLPFDRQGVLLSSTLYKASPGTLRVRHSCARSVGSGFPALKQNPTPPIRGFPGETIQGVHEPLGV